MTVYYNKMQQVEKMIDIAEGESWTPYLQRVNQLFVDEKQARHEGDNVKLIKICCEIVSSHTIACV